MVTRKSYQDYKETSVGFYDVVNNVLITEKTTKMIEFENKLVLDVKKDANKPLIKKLVEDEFKKKVKKVNTQHSTRGSKLAVVTFEEESAAGDIAADMGLV